MSKPTLSFAFFAFFLACWPVCAETFSEDTRTALSQVKVGILYENVTDNASLKRSPDDMAALLKATHADFLFRGFWKWEPVVELPDMLPPPLLSFWGDQNGRASPSFLAAKIEKSGKSYRSLGDWILIIKRQNPSLIFCGGVPAQHLMRVEIDPISGHVYTSDETWAMALDPQKWKGTFRKKAPTKEEMQRRFSGDTSGTYDRREARSYVPDITNPEFQTLLESFAKKQIDLGADAIWIDRLFAQSKMFYEITKDVQHPAVRDSAMAAVKIVDDLHRYGTERGKNILIGSWGLSGDDVAAFPSPPTLDFVTVTPSQDEIDKGQLDDAKWSLNLAVIRKTFGDIPIFAFIDWSLDASPLASFSQKFKSEDQKKWLQTFDVFFAQKGVNFIYPVRGGYMGKTATKTAFGDSSIYDSLAPEFDSFGTITALATAKAASR